MKKQMVFLLTLSIILLTLPPATFAGIFDVNSLFEAQLLTLEVEGQLRPSEEITEQIYNDLSAIRSAYPEVALITFLPHAVTDEIMIGLTEEAAEQFRNGQYHALDELNETYGVIQVEGHSSFLILKFDQIYNTELLSQIYTDANLQGVRYAEPNYRYGDGSTIIAEPPFYIFIHGWGDCPSGCINHEYWSFKVEDGQAIELNGFYVDAVNGDNDNLGLTPKTAFATIQMGINSADDGSTVIVLPGTYTGEGNRDIDFLGKAITVKSENGPENCIIDCENLGKGFYFHNNEDEHSVLNGFSIINGYSTRHGQGAGIYFSNSSPLIKNCIIKYNNLNGIFFYHSDAFIENCIIANNTWGIHGSYSKPTIKNSFINENSGVIGGIYFHSFSDLILTNCLVSNNFTTTNGCPGIQLGWETSFTITNCTIIDNYSVSEEASAGGIVYYSSGTVVDSIIWNNWGPEISAWFPESPGIIKVSYSDIEGDFPGFWNIDNDPLLTQDGHLLNGSPCINAGDPNYIPEPNETDLDGNPRILDDRIDMGAYEFVYTNLPPIADAGPNKIAYADHTGQAQITLDGSASYDTDEDELTYYWNWLIDGDVCDTNGLNPTIELPAGEHLIELIVNDGTEDSEPNYTTITVIEPLQADLYIYPTSIVRHNRAKRITALIRLPRGITKDEIDSDTKLVLYPGGIEAKSQVIRRRRRRGVTILASFDKAELMNAIENNGRVELQIIGRLKTGQYFYGEDSVTIRTRRRRTH